MKIAEGGAGGERLPGSSFPKRCSCGAVQSERGWMALPCHGVFQGTDECSGRKFAGTGR